MFVFEDGALLGAAIGVEVGPALATGPETVHRSKIKIAATEMRNFCYIPGAATQEVCTPKLTSLLSPSQTPFCKELNTVQTRLPSTSTQDEYERRPVSAQDKLVLATYRPDGAELTINWSFKLCGAGKISKVSVHRNSMDVFFKDLLRY